MEFTIALTVETVLGNGSTVTLTMEIVALSSTVASTVNELGADHRLLWPASRTF